MSSTAERMYKVHNIRHTYDATHERFGKLNVQLSNLAKFLDLSWESN